MNKKHGPNEIIIPEIRFNTCNGCEFFKKTLIRSGKNPIFRYTCNIQFTKENINNNMPTYITDDLESSNRVGVVIYSDYNDGYCHTPDWCSILNDTKNYE